MVKLIKFAVGVEVWLNGSLFTRLALDSAVPKVIFHPLCTPSGAEVTRPLPPADGPALSDHPHHRGLWTAHGAVAGIDFWEEYRPEHGTITLADMQLSNTDSAGHLRLQCHWQDQAGQPVLHEARHVMVWREADINILAMQSTLSAGNPTAAITFGDTKEGGLAAVRVAPGMITPGQGCILNAEGLIYQHGQSGPEATWGKRSRWVRYSGPATPAKPATIAIAHLPGSFRHPTWWHVRGYGLFAANPFAWSFFENSIPNQDRDPAISGAYHLPAGEALISRFMVAVADGVLQPAQIERLYHSYQPQSRSFGPDKTFDA